MNAAEIRELAIDRMAGMFGDVRSEAGHKAARALVTPYVDALGDLLPTSTEEQGGEIYRSLKGHVIGGTPAEVRYVTDWRPAK